jgi:hypothetical protein
MISHTSFIRDESGAGTAWWILWMIIFLIFGGLAVDSSNAWRMRAELQATADASAHAGVIDLPNVNAAASAADGMATTNMPFSEHGDVLSNAEIEFGTWDLANSIFVKDTGAVSPDAIRVTTRRDATNDNRLQTYFLRLIGMSSWNVDAQAVAQRYWPECLNKDALIARHVVDLQSNNDFTEGLCIHGNDHVEVNNNNCWEPGVLVTMPKLADFVAPSNGWESDDVEDCDNARTDGKNPGLADALGEEWFDPKIVDQVHTVLNAMLDPTSADMPSYIGTDADGDPIEPGDILKPYTSQQFDVGLAVPGHIYYVTCPGNSLLNLGNNVVLKKVVIITECRIATGNNSVYEDVVLGSFSGDKQNGQYSKSINIGQGNRMGVDDSCDPDGNVKLFAGGSIHSAADLQFYGVQAVAVWDVHLAAQAQGLEGIQVLAGNDVDIASNNAFGGGCSGGVNAVQVPYFRLVL